MNDLTVGTRVRVGRDETRYPPKGSWPKYRGQVGTVVEINDDEYGVVFGRVRKARANGSIAMAEAVWFRRHEIHALASQRPAEPHSVVPSTGNTGELVDA